MNSGQMPTLNCTLYILNQIFLWKMIFQLLSWNIRLS